MLSEGHASYTAEVLWQYCSQKHKQEWTGKDLKVQAQIGTRDIKDVIRNHCLMHGQVIK